MSKDHSSVVSLPNPGSRHIRFQRFGDSIRVVLQCTVISHMSQSFKQFGTSSQHKPSEMLRLCVQTTVDTIDQHPQP
jgi:hypothetical protein